MTDQSSKAKTMRRPKLTQLDRGIQLGILYAAADLARYIYDIGDAAALLKRQGLADADCSTLEEMDKEQLRLLRDEYGLNGLRGLD